MGRQGTFALTAICLFLGATLIAHLAHDAGVRAERAREQAAQRGVQQESTHSKSVGTAAVAGATSPLAPEVRAGLARILEQVVPAQYSTLSMGVDTNVIVLDSGLVPCRMTRSDGTVLSTTVDRQLNLTARREDSNWVIDDASVGVAWPPDAVRGAIEACVDAADKAEEEVQKGRIAWERAAGKVP